MELPDSITALESGKFYHLNFADGTSQEALSFIANALSANGVRALFTMGEFTVTSLCDSFNGMSPEHRELIRKSLDYVDLREHEQTK